MKRTIVTFTRVLSRRRTFSAPYPGKRGAMGPVGALLLAVMLFAPVVAVAQAEYWGSFKKGQCVAMGVRHYSSVLEGIPWGQSWEVACEKMAAPTTIDGKPVVTGSKRCEKETVPVTGIGVAMWGNFHVRDSSCPHWGPESNYCANDRDHVRYYRRALLDIPQGTSWQQVCENFPADVAGKHFDKPTKCFQELQEEALFAFDDPSCPKVGAGTPVSSTPPGWNCPPKPACPDGYLPSCEMLASGSPGVTSANEFPQCDAKGWYCCGGFNLDPSRCPQAGNRYYPAGCK